MPATFDACLTRGDVDFCDDYAFSYLYGDTVILKDRVSPVHDSAVVLRQAPHSDEWRRAGEVTIPDTGRMRWRWGKRGASGWRSNRGKNPW